jgi:hypothetical protein
MSHIDEGAQFILGMTIIGLITIPIWGPPYLIWWIVKGKREYEEDERRRKEADEEHKRNPPSRAPDTSVKIKFGRKTPRV